MTDPYAAETLRAMRQQFSFFLASIDRIAPQRALNDGERDDQRTYRHRIAALDTALQAIGIVERLRAMDPKGPDGEGWQQCIFCGTNAEGSTPQHDENCLWSAAKLLVK